MEVSLNLLNKYVKIDDQDPKELADRSRRNAFLSQWKQYDNWLCQRMYRSS